jgi:arsenate reductase
VIIYYNEECSKCKEALAILKENNCEIEIRNYLTDPPSKAELTELLKKLGCKPEQLLRKSESLFQEKFVSKSFSDEEWLTILSENPVLIERPIVVSGSRALIGRPPSTVLNLV